MVLFEIFPNILLTKPFLEIQVVFHSRPRILQFVTVVFHQTTESVFEEIRVWFSSWIYCFEVRVDFGLEFSEHSFVLLFESKLPSMDRVETGVFDD